MPRSTLWQLHRTRHCRGSSAQTIPTGPGSALLRSLRKEVREHGLDRLALALGARRMRFRMLRDVLLAIEDCAALLATVLVGRHRRFLQARTFCVCEFVHTRHALQARYIVC